MHNSLIHRHISIPSNHDASIVLQPGNRPFDDPSLTVPAKGSSVLPFRLATIDFMRAHQLQATFFQTITQRIRIVRTIRHKMAARLFRQRRFIQRCLDQFYLVRGRACHVHSERKTLAARHHHKLCTFSTFGFSHAEAPFFAGQNVPSAKMFIQWSWPCSSNSWIRAIQACSPISCSSQSLSLTLRSPFGLPTVQAKRHGRDRDERNLQKDCCTTDIGGEPFVFFLVCVDKA